MDAATGHPSLEALARQFGLVLHGAGDARITGVATLRGAGPGQLAYFSNRRHRSELRSCRAAAVVLQAGDAGECPVPTLVCENPQVAFARIAALFEGQADWPAGTHASATVDAAAAVDPTASIGPHCHVAAGARVLAGARLGPACIIGPDCVVGQGCELVARVTLVERVRLGARVRIHPGAVLGASGFGLVMDEGHWRNVPQLGGVVVGDDCEIGANTTIDRGALDDTVLGADVRLDNQIQIGHNVRIGDHAAMAGCSAIAGSTHLGAYCLVGGGAGILGHLEICERVTITAMSLVSRSITSPGEYSSGVPLQDKRSWRRNAVRFKRLDEMARRLGLAAKEQEKP